MKQKLKIKEGFVKYSKGTALLNNEPLIITEANMVVEIMRAVPDFTRAIEHKELVYSIYLNRANEVLSITKISEGGVNCSIIDLRIVIQPAILLNASGVILIHNHPSGGLEASKEDIKIKEKLKTSLNLFSIELIDSLIITKNSFKSY